ncbi:MAG: AAA family ATPase [Candidatus Bathyarchaeota archaeon]|nr:AAA family ATPase [Candidatus Bathyarchaeota archaeon]
MKDTRVPTGVTNLDASLEGGIPRGNMVLIAGNAGTGKTLLAGEFLYSGAAAGEQCLYVSLAEGRASFIDYMLKAGRDLDDPSLPGVVNVMDLLTVKEQGTETLIEGLLERVEELGAQRLVIDSFTALATAFAEPIDARVTLHILGKLTKRSGCTTLLITEIPSGGSSIGIGVEEFLADGIILLKRMGVGGSVTRSLEVVKMRGTEIGAPQQLFTLHRGFKALEPFREKPRNGGPPFHPTADSGDRYGTGTPQLDAATGGLRRGDTMLIRLGEGVPPIAPALLLAPLRANFIHGGRPVTMIPPGGTGPDRIARFDEAYGVTQTQLNRLLRVYTPDPAHEAPYAIRLDDPQNNQRRLAEEETRLHEATGKPLLRIIYVDGFEDLCPGEQARRMLDAKSRQTKNEGGLLVLLTQPGSESERHASNLSNTQLTIGNEQGVFLLQGLQPRTQLYALEMEDGASYPKVRLTPMQ